MSNVYKVVIQSFLLHQSSCLITSCVCQISDDDKGSKQPDICPLWHVPGQNVRCECGNSHNGIVSCIHEFLYIKHGNCMTWNNSTKQAELQSCLFSQWNSDEMCEKYAVPDTYRIPANISGSELDYVTCKGYNRQGAQCRQCIDGYMDLQHFLMVLLVLTPLNTNTCGF